MNCIKYFSISVRLLVLFRSSHYTCHFLFLFILSLFLLFCVYCFSSFFFFLQLCLNELFLLFSMFMSSFWLLEDFPMQHCFYALNLIFKWDLSIIICSFLLLPLYIFMSNSELLYSSSIVE